MIFQIPYDVDYICIRLTCVLVYLANNVTKLDCKM